MSRVCRILTQAWTPLSFAEKLGWILGCLPFFIHLSAPSLRTMEGWIVESRYRDELAIAVGGMIGLIALLTLLSLVTLLLRVKIVAVNPRRRLVSALALLLLGGFHLLHGLGLFYTPPAEYQGAKLPTTAADWYTIGVMYFNQEQYTEALRAYSHAIARDARHAAAYNDRCVSHFHLGQTAQAIADCTRAIALNYTPRSRPYYNLGYIYAHEGDDTQAIAHYTQALALTSHTPPAFISQNSDEPPSNPETSATLAQDYHAAIKRDPQTVLAASQELLRENAENAAAYYYRGLAHYYQARYAAAMEDFEKAVDLNLEQAQVYYQRGTVYAAGEDYALAIQDFDAALDRHLTNADIYFYRGLASYYTDKYIRALQDFEKASTLPPECVAIYFQRGIAHSLSDHSSQALQDFARTLELDPGYLDAYFNRGNVYMRQEDYAQAIAAYDKVLARNPDDAAAYHKRGIAYYYLGDYAKAIQDFDTTLERSPDTTIAYYNRGLAYTARHETTRAIQDFERFLTLNENPDWEEEVRHLLQELQ
ncbi:tetratricopeptide repeat protein [candidate division KSB3 bacterium]|uniref:Tetratricopeptide repeat protein n=1 Tax=candidate division KSB3 bacterium TaxID=2044937 RepID=A0A9D5JZU0_9BACT|nr:tetratricopeptide repeat protein [candidate division KSB3 bacterium]MBD3327175.1 tetratricopeptide repeat protein [candidate division KSB3 bacterium]